MVKRILNSTIVMCGLVSCNLYASFVPKTLEVDLNERTAFELNVMPDLGVQFIFPFILDSKKLRPKFKVFSTNQNVFCIGGVCSKGEKTISEINGQNTLTLTINKSGVKGGKDFEKTVHLGSLLINVNGYHIAITLKTNTNPQKHYTNVVFKLNESDRRYLIEKEVEHLRKAQIETYNEKIKQLTVQARQKAIAYIGELALNDLNYVRVKHREMARIDNNEEIEILIDEFHDYQKYTLLKFYVRNLSNTNILIKNADVVRFDDKQRLPVVSSLLCEKMVRPGEEMACVITTQDHNLVESEHMAIVFSSNHGVFSIESQW